MAKSSKINKTAICLATDGIDHNRLSIAVWSIRKFIGEDIPKFVLTENHILPFVEGVRFVSPTKGIWKLGFFSLNWNRSAPFSSLYRLAIPLMDEFEGFDKVVFIDTDALVMSEAARDLLLNTDMGSHEVAGVPDVELAHVKTRDIINSDALWETSHEMKRQWEEWNIDDKLYINSGVIVMNLRAIRDNGLDWYRERMRLFWDVILAGRFRHVAQDAINFMMDTCTALDYRCNCVSKYQTDRSVIVRYSGAGEMYHLHDAVKMGYTMLATAQKDMDPPGDARGSRQLVLYICHIVNDETIWRYRKLKSDVADMNIDLLWILNKKSPGDDTGLPDDIRCRIVRDEEVHACRKYIAPGDAGPSLQFHGPNYMAMKFAVEYKDYDYVWYLEYDVCYSGNWASFFSRMNERPHDLITACVIPRAWDPGWYWWVKSRDVAPWNKTFKSVNCIARLSRKMIDALEKFYVENEDRYPTFFETLWATKAVNELSCYDIYPTECIPEYSVYKIRNFSFVVKDKIYHAVKDNIHWQDFVK